MEPVFDEITIEDFFSFEAWATVTREDNHSLDVKFTFIVSDYQDLQIVGSLFNEGQEVQLKSAMIARLHGVVGPVKIKCIDMPKDALSWECMVSLK